MALSVTQRQSMDRRLPPPSKKFLVGERDCCDVIICVGSAYLHTHYLSTFSYIVLQICIRIQVAKCTLQTLRLTAPGSARTGRDHLLHHHHDHHGHHDRHHHHHHHQDEYRHHHHHHHDHQQQPIIVSIIFMNSACFFFTGRYMSASVNQPCLSYW